MLPAGITSCFQNLSHDSRLDNTQTLHQTHSNSLLYGISMLKDKVHQAQSLIGILISPDHHQNQPQATSIAVANMGSLVQEIIVTASSIMFTCQQMSTQPSNFDDINTLSETFDLYGGGSYYNNSCNINEGSSRNVENLEINKGLSKINDDIIELDAANLLAKYTHYCQVCGKGFKRDANLRMHMRAHGDEYKTSAALINPLKNVSVVNGSDQTGNKKLYSCPQEGCRWNQKHVKFQPLKSRICVKNHYKRSHCPKMYVCKRCNRKQFSVLSDLRTHEKHCGDLKWMCSCGTTFSRKDKLLGHVALFVGHTPAINVTPSKTRKVEYVPVQLDDDR